MRVTREMLGMPITIEIADDTADGTAIERGFDLFRAIDARFSTYRSDSEISTFNRGLLGLDDLSPEMLEVLNLAEDTRRLTDGYFDIRTPAGTVDPSGIVKGWAIQRVARLLAEAGSRNFIVNAGGDIQAAGTRGGTPWTVGIQNPFDPMTLVKVLRPGNHGVATSGNYVRGQHIYGRDGRVAPTGVVSLTVVGPDIFEADRFATAAFAMGGDGIALIERTAGLEGYMIDPAGIGTMTSNFNRFVAS